MPSRLAYSVAVGPNLGPEYPAVFKEELGTDVELAARCGCLRAELHVRSPELVDVDALLKRCDETGLRFTTISTGMGYAAEGLSLIDEDESVRRKTLDRLYGMMELAKRIGSSVIIGLLRGMVPDFSRYPTYEARLAANLGALVERAEVLGVELELEPISRPQCNYINSTHDALEWVERFGSGKLKVLLDTYHMNIEDRDPERCVVDAGDMLGYLHFSDSNRRRPGSGSFDFPAVIRGLRAIGFGGFVGLEYVPSPRPDEELLETLAYLESIERELDAGSGPGRAGREGPCT